MFICIIAPSKEKQFPFLDNPKQIEIPQINTLHFLRILWITKN